MNGVFESYSSHSSYSSYHSLSVATARFVADYIRANPGALLCLAAGDTPLGAFAELVRMNKTEQVDLGSVFYVGLDEWVGLGPEDLGSCWQVMHDNFYTPAGIPKERMRVFDGLAEPAEECERMDEWVRRHGGIGLTLLGVGMNGHVGFNEPYDRRLACREDVDRRGRLSYVVPLDETTKSVSTKYFGAPRPVTHGVTISLEALRAARQIIVMASGEKKREIIRKSFYSEPSPEVPASMLQGHGNLIFLTDFNI